MIKMYKIGDKFKPKGRTFNTVIYEITKVEYNDFKNETLYTNNITAINNIVYQVIS